MRHNHFGDSLAFGVSLAVVYIFVTVQVIGL